MQMKIIKWVLSSIGILGVLLVGTMEFVERGNTPRSYYENYEQARLSGSMDRGWIPIYIPKSAVKIDEQHSIDSGWVEMSFEYDVNDKLSVQGNCETSESNKEFESYTCEYFGNVVKIKLFSNGKGELNSSPVYRD